MMAAKKQRTYWETENSLETGEPEPVEEYPSESRVVVGSLWMLAITLVFFFIPVANGIVGGVIGGYRVGSARNALMAALGPIFLGTCFLWMLYTLLPINVMGSPLSQIGAAGLILLSDIGLLIGAAIGGTVSYKSNGAPDRA